MSHFTRLATAFVDRDALMKGLADVGFSTAESHDKPVQLHGYLGDVRSSEAHIVIPKRYVGRLSNDIGFHKAPDGRYTAIISEYDRNKYGERWLNSLRQRYAYHAAIDRLTEQGFELVDSVDDVDATIRLTLRRLA